MSVKVNGNQIVLEGRCGVEEAETVLAALLASPDPLVILAAERIHSAIWQVLLAARAPLQGDPPNDFAGRFVVTAIRPPLAGEGRYP